jgi:preflagellin peptidase FlaK
MQADPALSWPLIVQEWGDVLRVLVVPLFVWTAWHDIQTRRVPNWVWKPPFVLGIVLLAWDGWGALQVGGYGLQLFLVATGISLFVVIPLAVGFHRMGGFGAADMKALVVIALLFPTYPSYIVPNSTLTFPMVESPVNAFALTALTNGVLVGIAYPLTLLTRNLLTRSIPEEPWVLFVGRAIDRGDIIKTHGRLLETTQGYTRAGLDLDALRMYLAWRECDLRELVEDPATARDPTSLPDEPGRVGGGAVTDGGRDVSSDGEGDLDSEEGSSTSARDGRGDSEDSAGIEDPWGANAFLEDIPGSAYGTTPTMLRDGLEVLTSEERVWVSPGIPFLVPLVLGLLVAFVYGDVLVALLDALGLMPGI